MAKMRAKNVSFVSTRKRTEGDERCLQKKKTGFFFFHHTILGGATSQPSQPLQPSQADATQRLFVKKENISAGRSVALFKS